MIVVVPVGAVGAVVLHVRAVRVMIVVGVPITEPQVTFPFAHLLRYFREAAWWSAAVTGVCLFLATLAVGVEVVTWIVCAIVPMLIAALVGRSVGAGRGLGLRRRIGVLVRSGGTTSTVVGASRMRSGAVVGASSMRSAAVVSTTAAGTADSLEPACRSFSRLIFTEARVLSGRA